MKLPPPREPRRLIERFSPLWSGLTGAGPRGRHAAGSIPRETTGDPIYGEPLALAAAVPTRLLRCLHCGEPIRHVAGQGWIHRGERGTFACRDSYGLTINDQYATAPAEDLPAPHPSRSHHRDPTPASRGADAPPASTTRPRPSPAIGSVPYELVEHLRLTNSGETP